MRKAGQPIWFELPNDRGNIDSVESHLRDWASLYDLKLKDEVEARNLFLNSVVHGIECALLLWLAPYANVRGFDSGIFIDGVELAHYCNSHAFPNGYPLEMIEALSLCYSFESPWNLSEEYANKYATELVVRLKDLALYSVEELEYLKVELKKHRSGRKKGTKSKHKAFVENALEGLLGKSNKELWKILKEKIDNDNDACPLECDEATDRINFSSNAKEYTFKSFTNHLAEIRKK